MREFLITGLVDLPNEMIKEVAKFLTGTERDHLRQVNKLFSRWIPRSRLRWLELLTHCMSRDFLLFQNYRQFLYLKEVSPTAVANLKLRKRFEKFYEEIVERTIWGIVRIQVYNHSGIHNVVDIDPITKRTPLKLASITIWVDGKHIFSFYTHDTYNFFKHGLGKNYSFRYKDDLLSIVRNGRRGHPILYETSYKRETFIKVPKFRVLPGLLQ